MRPTLSFLSPSSLDTIVGQARDTLDRFGVEIHHPEAVECLSAAGGRVDSTTRRVRIGGALVDRALASVSHRFSLFDARGRQTHDFEGRRVHFTPGSAALLISDAVTGESRRPVTADYVQYVKLVSRLEHLPAQSTAMIPADVPDAIADAYRLYLSLRGCEKPVVTGAFSAEGLTLMRDLLAIVRGGEQALRERPLAMFTCCPTSPLKWGDAACSNLVDCARAGIPVEIVTMPLAGMTAPVTPFGMLAQHTAEALSGVVIAQLTNPGTPLLFGSSLGILDVRTMTTPLGAIESMRLSCASSEIGHHLGLPTQAYMGLSDAKRLDTQSGIESATGATLAALGGVNSVSGAGMHEFENSFSPEKLVVDHEACAMALRLTQQLEPAGDVPVAPLIEELLRERQLVIADHTRAHLKGAIAFPSAIIDRAARPRWEETGRQTLVDRARAAIARHLADYTPPEIPSAVTEQLDRRMAAAATANGMARLPTGL